METHSRWCFVRCSGTQKENLYVRWWAQSHYFVVFLFVSVCYWERVSSHIVYLAPPPPNRHTHARTSILSPCFISLFFASSPLQAKATQACRWQIMTVLSPLASCVSKCMCVWVCAQCLFSSLPIVGCKAALGYLLAGCLDDWVTGWLTDWWAHSSLVYLLLIY